jgi:maltooligosyltrehalose trehalohydrolase
LNRASAVNNPYPPCFGALLDKDGQTMFRLWAPSCPAVHLVIEGQEPVAMQADMDGFLIIRTHAPQGTRYHYQLPDGMLVSDPASRLQAEDVHGPSVVVDPDNYTWKNTDWRGHPWHEAVVYEVHAGVMGGFNGIREHLPRLCELGITAIEIMPVADFPGPRNWGYDGVLPYAPDTVYGTPDDLKALWETTSSIS